MKMTERGQITIPKNLREKFGLTPLTSIQVVEQNGRLVVLKSPQRVAVFERLRGTVEMKESTDEYIAAIRGRDEEEKQ